ncbi:MAG: hypothetical protein HDT47_09705 [Ruminococcaceae bacterium]|nr:hypothetical protein [Oscillospiraceae bacterium]
MKKIVRHKDKKDIRNGKILDSLQGSVDELEQERDERDEQFDDPDFFDSSAPMMKNKKTFFAIGLIIIILTVVGLVNTVKFTVSAVQDIANQTSLKNEFAAFLYPVVIIDTPAFDTAENAPPSVVIHAAIWRIILNGNTERYENDGSYMTISEIDVESSAVALFGYGVTIEHQTVGNGENVFEYNASSRSYNVPMETERITYWPRIRDISSVGELFSLTVEYMAPVMGMPGEADEEQEAQKLMIYTVSRSATSMTVNSVAYYQPGQANEW